MTVTASDLLLFIISGAMMIALVSMVVLSILNKKRFLEVCQMYEAKFGSLPLAAAVLKEADVIGFTAGYTTKMDFIIHPLIYGKKSIHSKTMMSHSSEGCQQRSDTGLLQNSYAL